MDRIRRAVSDLQGDRPQGWGGPGPIPFVAVDRWAERYGVTDFESFHACVQAVNGARMEWEQDRAKRGGSSSVNADHKEARRRAEVATTRQPEG